MHLEIISRQPEKRRFETPLLFVHGAWHAAWCWDEHFLPWFADAGFEVHALSLRGHGTSDGDGRIRWHAISDYVADVARVANDLEHCPAVIGHSMGGFTVQKYLEKHRAPAGVLLASAPPRGVAPFMLRHALRDPISLLRALATLSPYALVDTPAKARAAFFSESLEDEQLRKYTSQLQEESYRAMLDMTVLNLPRPKRVDTPLLVLGAEADAIFNTAEVRATARAYQAEHESFPGMAHDAMLEPEWEKPARRIADWLAERLPA